MAISDLNFNRAEFSSGAPQANCVWCMRGLSDGYFDVKGARVCAVCAERARQLIPADTREKFWRSMLFGVLAAAVTGAALFMLIRIFDDGWTFFAAIGVGYVIGKAMRSGSHGVGGRRYQVMGAVLAYCAVVVAYSAAILTHADVPAWAYPLFVLAPILNMVFGHFSLGMLQLLFAGIGIRWAWIMLAGVSWKVTGPHPLKSQAARN